MKEINLPLTRDDARSLQIGETVVVSGTLFTGRSLFHIRAVEEDIYPPINFKEINGFFHVGPVMKKNAVDEWEVVSCEPTSSIRFERYSGEVIRKFNLRTLIGKTTMGEGTARALKDVGGVYLSKLGVSGNLLKKRVKTVRSVYFLDELGKTEATWVFDVDKLGPFFVAIDSDGNNYFQDLEREVRERLPYVEEILNIPATYSYTDVNAPK